MFLIHSTDDHRVVIHDLMPCSAMKHQVGRAMVLSEGKLVLATGTTKPEFICNQEAKEACADGALIAVTRVAGDITYETTCTGEASTLKIGDKVTIHTDGEQVTTSTQGGVAQVVAVCIDPNHPDEPDRVRVRFV